jgi:hypothetical protein
LRVYTPGLVWGRRSLPLEGVFAYTLAALSGPLRAETVALMVAVCPLCSTVPGTGSVTTTFNFELTVNEPVATLTMLLGDV